MHDFVVNQNIFKGPIELLVYLVKKYEIDIIDLDLSVLTEDYLLFIKRVKFTDIAKASRFIEIASILVEIKSFKLIPAEKENDTLRNELELDLKLRLKEYELFSNIADFFKSKFIYDKNYFSNEFNRLSKKYGSLELIEVQEPFLLTIYFENALKKLSRKMPLNLKPLKKIISVKEAMESIKKNIKKEILSFESIVYNLKLNEFIVYFIALLEIAKDSSINIKQSHPLSLIWIEKKH